MSRGLNAGQVDLLSSTVVRPAFFVRLHFKSGTVRLWTGSQPITLWGDTFSGIGALGDIGPIEESSDMSAKGVSLSLVGQGTGIYQAAMADSRQMQGREADVIFGAMSEDFETVLFAQLIATYKMDRLSVEDAFSDQGGGVRLTLQCEGENADMFSPQKSYYSDEEQRRIHPTDTFFRFMESMPGKELPFGQEVKYGARVSNRGSRGRP